jgi:hypothetical protein
MNRIPTFFIVSLLFIVSADLESGKSKHYLLSDSFLYYFNEKNILQLNSSLIITNRFSVDDKMH